MTELRSSIYQPLDWDEIRLLKFVPGVVGDGEIKCTLEPKRLAVGLKYTCLSYCWGGSSATESIELQGQSFNVTPNLMAALVHFRSFSPEAYFWIDAISINQEDDAEKSTQVMLMGSTYEMCTGLIIWLGPAEQDSNLAMQFVRRCGVRYATQQYQDDTETPTQADNHENILLSSTFEELMAVSQLFQRPYFRRRWIIQELILPSSKSSVLCGADVATLEELVTTARVIRQANQSDLTSERISRLISSHFKGNPPRILFELKMENATEQTLLDNLRSYRNSICRDPRDRIYALLSISEPELSETIRPDYSRSWQHVLCEWAVVMIKRFGAVDILSACEWDIDIHDDLPSWVPTWKTEAWGLCTWRGVSHFIDDFVYCSTSTEGTRRRQFSAGTELRVQAAVPPDNMNLKIRSTAVAHVMTVSQPTRDEANPSPEYSHLRIMSLCEKLREARCMILIGSVLADIDDEGLVELAFRVITCDLLIPIITYEQTCRSFQVLWDIDLNFLRFSEVPSDKRHLLLASIAHIDGITRRRCYLMTRSGSVGLGPAVTHRGDTVCVRISTGWQR